MNKRNAILLSLIIIFLFVVYPFVNTYSNYIPQNKTCVKLTSFFDERGDSMGSQGRSEYKPFERKQRRENYHSKNRRNSNYSGQNKSGFIITGIILVVFALLVGFIAFRSKKQ